MRTRTAAAAMLVSALAIGGVACSSDDTESKGTNEVCSAFAQVVNSLEGIQDVNVHDEGTQALAVSIQQLGSTLAQLAGEVSDALKPAVQELQTDVSTINETIDGLGSQPTDAQLNDLESQIKTAGASAKTAVSSANTELPDCNLTLD